MSSKHYVRWHFVLGVLMALGSVSFGAESPAPPQTPAATPPVIRLEKNQLSVQLTQHTLAEVLRALDKVIPLHVYYRGSQIAALRDTKISMTYDQEPLLVGIKRLLVGQNYMINYTPEAEAATGAKMLNIWFLSGTGSFSLLKPEAETADAETADAETADAATTEEPSVEDLIQTALTETDDIKRWDALDALINIENFEKNPEIVQTLWTALRQDKDPDVRRNALDGLEEVADADAPFEALAAVYQTDKDEAVRGSALNVLVQKYGLASKELVQQALQAPSKIVSTYAGALQRQLDELATMQSNASPPASPPQ